MNVGMMCTRTTPEARGKFWRNTCRRDSLSPVSGFGEPRQVFDSARDTLGTEGVPPFACVG